jgi:hypothetical protein
VTSASDHAAGQRSPSAAVSDSRRRARRVITRLLLPLAAALGLGLGLALSGGPSAPRAAAEPGSGEFAPHTDGSVPAHDTTMFGSTSAGETWGVGEVGHERWGIVHYRPGSGWAREQWLEANGAQPSPETAFKPPKSPLGGEITPAGSGALLGSVGPEKQENPREVLLVRNPGGAFQETKEPIPPALLGPGEHLFERERTPLLAALDENGHAGALVAPAKSGSGIEDGVLHWDGSKWTREKIEPPEASRSDFRVLALSASAPDNAWLLAQVASVKAGAVTLLHRVLGSEGTPPTWQPVPVKEKGTPGEPLNVLGEQFTVNGTGEPPIVSAPLLTVTKAGLWLDGETKAGRLTMFFKPSEGEEKAAVWCKFSTKCEGGTLEDELPVGPSRSFAWDSSQKYGDRVITGLNEGVTLRLEGTTFRRVLALGGGSENVGAKFGAAFASPREGWLGATLLPVHLTASKVDNQLTQYPVPFHHALLAVAPQPGAPIGSLASQALAVGNNGEVARYTPGEGWQPESLLNASGRRATPRLRALAWPTSARAYAVGDLGQMWLWRGEAGLWEPDPAAPRNFRDNLLGVAFDPNDSSRGFAVGQQGVLLRYGKSWAPEPQSALPEAAQGASFTSIAFAGSETLIAFRKPHSDKGINTYSGGVIVNKPGSGWTLEQGATAPLGPGGLPWAVAGLPDGGAAVSGEDIYGAPLVIERENATAPWQLQRPYPGNAAPGSLALFREGGELRAVGAGSIVSTFEADFGQTNPPPGFPPNLVTPYPAANGYIMRQTREGWSDEQHDAKEARPTAGEWATYDLPEHPDPTAAVLVDPGTGEGWAVGGEIDPNPPGRLDTAEAARYHEVGAAPAGVISSPVQLPSTSAATITFAIGGGAQCAAPCADREQAGVGPDRWLSGAISTAAQIKRGSSDAVSAFIYTGPRITEGKHLTQNNTLPPPYPREFARYAALLEHQPVTTLVVPSATDRVEGQGECKFQSAFAQLPSPLPSSECAREGSSYYAQQFSPKGSTALPVRVVVLDDSTGLDSNQLEWLENKQLKPAAEVGQAAIVVGNGDLEAEAERNVPGASQAIRMLVKLGASAYFYDSPQRNVSSQLRVPGLGSIPAYGSGTLGYSNSIQSERQDYTGHSGFLVADVTLTRPRCSVSVEAVCPSSAVPKPRLIPNLGELALEAKDGVLLRRSQSALFAALARRPRAGCVTTGTRSECESSQYIPIPANYVGPSRESVILPEYEFKSSKPKIGNFVKPNLAVSDQHAVQLGGNGEPEPDPASGLFCAFNAGTTVATISAGGLSAALTVTVQAGSVRRPCGTVPLNETAGEQQALSPTPPPPAPTPAPAGTAPSATPPPVPVPAPPLAPPPVRGAVPPPPFLPLQAPLASLLAFVPPPLPTPARPTPPSGTSPVPSQAVEKEEEEEEAPESVSNKAVAYRSSEHEPSPGYILGVVLLAAFAGASIRRPRRDGRAERIAPATLSTTRAQRRAARSRVTKW